MRVLHIDTGTGWRGGQQQVLWLMEALRARGFEQLLLASANSPLVHRARKGGLPVAELTEPMMSLANLQTVRANRSSFDLVHAHDSHAHSLAALAALGFFGPHRPLVVSRRVPLKAGDLLKGPDERIFFYDGGQRHWVPSLDVFGARGFSWDAVQLTPDYLLKDIPEGTPLT